MPGPSESVGISSLTHQAGTSRNLSLSTSYTTCTGITSSLYSVYNKSTETSAEIEQTRAQTPTHSSSSGIIVSLKFVQNAIASVMGISNDCLNTPRDSTNA